MNKEDLIKSFGEFHFEKINIHGLSLSDGPAYYVLDNDADLITARDHYIESKEYEIAKILNYFLAILEVENKESCYRHYPVILHIELTDFCNCRCIMCTHAYTKNDGSSFADLSSVRKYFPTCRLIVINGIGEPFLHPEIIEILKEFKEYKIKVSTTTNLTFLPDELLGIIPDVFVRISVSCDGAVPETFEQIRRHGNMATVIENAVKVRKAAPGVILHMAVTSMRQNLLESSEIVILAAKCGFNEVRFGRLETNPLLMNEKDCLTVYPNIASEILQEAVRLGKSLGLSVNIPVIFRGAFDKELAAEERERLTAEPFFKDEPFYEMLHEKYIEYRQVHVFEHYSYKPKGVISCEGICHWLALGSNINIKGQIRPCGEIIRELSDKGTLKEGDDILNTAEQIELRNIYNSGFLPDVCSNCSYMLSNEFDWCRFNHEEYCNYYNIPLQKE